MVCWSACLNKILPKTCKNKRNKGKPLRGNLQSISTISSWALLEKKQKCSAENRKFFARLWRQPSKANCRPRHWPEPAPPPPKRGGPPPPFKREGPPGAGGYHVLSSLKKEESPQVHWGETQFFLSSRKGPPGFWRKTIWNTPPLWVPLAWSEGPPLESTNWQRTTLSKIR